MTARTVSELALNGCYDVELLCGVTMFMSARCAWILCRKGFCAKGLRVAGEEA